jgi:hypothetical protein
MLEGKSELAEIALVVTWAAAPFAAFSDSFDGVCEGTLSARFENEFKGFIATKLIATSEARSWAEPSLAAELCW